MYEKHKLRKKQFNSAVALFVALAIGRGKLKKALMVARTQFLQARVNILTYSTLQYSYSEIHAGEFKASSALKCNEI